MNIVPSTSSLQTTLPNLERTSENKAIIAETIQVLESLNLDKGFKPIKATHVVNHADPLYQHFNRHISSNRMDPPPPPPPPPRPPTPPYSASDCSAFQTHRTATRVLNGNGNSSRGGSNPPRGGGHTGRGGGHAGRGGSNPPRGGGHAGRGGSNPPRGGGHPGRGGSNPPRGGGHAGRGGSYATRGRS